MGPRVLVASPVRQPVPVLDAFLRSLDALDSAGATVDFAFVDDNDEPEAQHLLEAYARGVGATVLAAPSAPPRYHRTGPTHRWTPELVDRVADHKDRLLALAVERGYDAIFLVDSDLVLDPTTLRWLLEANRDVVAEVFWTRFTEGGPLLPQVWLANDYQLYPRQYRGETVPPAEAMARCGRFLRALRRPGVYPVGGLGACTLIRRRVLEVGVTFASVPTLDWLGEDRHFAVRAAVAGFGLFVDTHAPALHLYRPADLARVPHFLRECTAREAGRQAALRRGPRATPHVTVSMVMRNEAGRYLERVVRQAARLADAFVVVDDASSDDSVAVVRRAVGDRPLHLVRNAQSAFDNELVLRQQQWLETLATGPDWIHFCDADELLEPAAVEALPALLSDPMGEVVALRLFDFWSPTHYREDHHFAAHLTYRPFLLRYQGGTEYRWRVTPLHCGRMPRVMEGSRVAFSDIRVQHLGWADPADRILKQQRYLAADPLGVYGDQAQYLAISAPSPHRVPWQEDVCAVDPAPETSRFFARGDPRLEVVLGPLPPAWWSRPYEYAWADGFCGRDHTVLDAGSGVGHPFADHLATRCREVHAVDADPRVLSQDAIRAAVSEAVGEDAARRRDAQPARARRWHARLECLPFSDGAFDRVVCLSVLEHLDAGARPTALSELRRVLRPGGLLLVTVDVPLCPLPELLGLLDAAGLAFAGDWRFELPGHAVRSPGPRRLHCARAVLRRAEPLHEGQARAGTAPGDAAPATASATASAPGAVA